MMTLLWFSQTRGLNGGSSGGEALVPGIHDQSQEPGVEAPASPGDAVGADEGPPEAPGGDGAGLDGDGGSWAKNFRAPPASAAMPGHEDDQGQDDRRGED